MIKKKAMRAGGTEGKTTGKARKKSAGKKKRVDPAQVREQIAGLVNAGAKQITQAVIDQAAQGELAPAKYLFEMAGIYPKLADGEQQVTEEEDCLAKTLLARLDAGKAGGQEVPTSRAQDARETGHPDGTEKENAAVAGAGEVGSLDSGQ